MNAIERWARAADAPIDYQRLKARLAFLGDRLFNEYEPTLARGPQFGDRLAHWLNNAADEEDQRLMFELAGELYFVGSMEMALLYQDVLHGPVSWWLIDTCGVELIAPDLEVKLEDAISRTWFCPVSDSMQIARFHHINNISGKNFRPDWHTLSELGDQQRIARYMEEESLAQLVLIEDFVGSGNQASRALRFVCENLPPDVPVLFAPLLICPSGVDTLERLFAELGDGRVQLRPMVILPPDCVLQPEPQAAENDRRALMRQLLQRLDPLVAAPHNEDELESLYGYGVTGALSVLYTNCPNNVPPLIHYESERWSPLFPRSVRK